MRRLALGLFGSAVLMTFVCLGGCTIDLHGTGELGVKQTSSWSLYHRSEQEAVDTKASAGVDAPSFVEWLLGLDKEEVPDDAPID